MYTALRATSQTLAEFLRQRFISDASLANFFDPVSGGTMLVTLSTPEEMAENDAEGLSVWLYRIMRDEQRLNAPPERVSYKELRRAPLPLRLHYLLTPITASKDLQGGPETEQAILGKVLQALHDHPVMRGTDLQGELSGTASELSVRLEPLTLEEIARVWDALDGSYQLSVSYEVSFVQIASDEQPEAIAPVEVVMPEYGVIVGS
jgi:Pvc16 N-terminal domain